MTVRDCVILAIEGTHCAGKTTLALALTARLQAAGVNVGYFSDPARDSPLVSEVVAGADHTFHLDDELDLIAATISGHIRAARRHAALVVDKTAANVLAYASLLLPEQERPRPGAAGGRGPVPRVAAVRPRPRVPGPIRPEPVR